MAITKDQIFQIADELDQAGTNPTLAAIRKVLGKGSYTTISQAMGEWRQLSRTRSERSVEPLPSELMDHLSQFGSDLWEISLKVAEDRFNSRQKQCDEAKAALEASRDEAISLADLLTEELDAAKESVKRAEAAETKAIHESKRLSEKLAAATERALSTEARAQEAERRATDLNNELQRVNDMNRQLVDALAKKP